MAIFGISSLLPTLAVLPACNAIQKQQQENVLNKFAGNWQVVSARLGNEVDENPGGAIQLEVSDNKLVGGLIGGPSVELKAVKGGNLEGQLNIGIAEQNIQVPVTVEIAEDKKLTMVILTSEVDTSSLPVQWHQEFTEDVIYVAEKTPASSTSELEEVKTPELEAQKNIGVLTEAKQGFFVEFGTFTSKMNNLGLDIPSDTKHYSYRVKELDNSLAQSLAIPKEEGLRSYTGGIFATPIEGTTRMTTTTIVCQSNQPSQTPPDSPALIEGIPQCPEGFQSISE
ncbi:MAG: type IV pilin-like G/H family protein [Spirulinaceae cyanobacterium]